MSFYTALSGLKAAQTDMASISHNIANASTNGFKKSRAEFADIISSSVSLSPTQMIGSGTAVKANRQQFGQGNLVQSSSSLDLAISGDGFFAVKPDPNSATVNYTRNGAFLVDANNNVTDANGNFLQVYPVDGSGNVTQASMGTLQNLTLPATSGNPKATQDVTLGVNLNAKTALPLKTPFNRLDASSYNQATTTTVYDAGGNPMTMTSYYVRDTAPIPSNPPAADDLSSTWSVYSFVGDQKMTAGGSDSVQLQFGNTGQLTAPATKTTFDAFTPASGTAQAIALDLNASTQTAAPFKLAAQTQDGLAVGQLQGVTVDDAGIVKASFSNGDIKALGQVALINFSNPSGLRQLGDSGWASTGVSGTPIAGSAGQKGLGNLMSGTIERSNVDITEELVNLIAAQRNFQANAKALDTSSQISQTIFNIRS
ncbi:Flagellar hook protein FlgE [Sphingomonas sp. EC-HK361]|uniref:flagellar hook protein FlgE n=1 Tax=Sphingomonas sp. EC-HK361 TaxID=2038397 RepID=UPI001251D532|nr:flagellar hook protein FlgE [Sphingomonas sp. EC-HK361]VVT16237.1 Flagellar hook protein FlgE [Sphingomonas sp. EC-HK361]